MAIEGPNDLSGVLEWALGLSATLYACTAVYLLATIHGFVNDVQKAADALEKELRQHMADQVNALWSAHNGERESAQRFREEILRDLRDIPKRSDLQDMEIRLTRAVKASSN